MKNGHALLIIDMQLVAFDGKITPAISNGEKLLGQVNALMRICRDAGLPIVYVQTCAASGRPYAKDVHGWEIHPQLKPQSADSIIYKKNSSGFDGTDLKEALRRLKISTTIVCGIWSEFCVTNTSLDALQNGFNVCTVADAHGTVSDSEDAAAAIIARQNDFLSERGVVVLPINDLQNEFSDL